MKTIIFIILLTSLILIIGCNAPVADTNINSEENSTVTTEITSDFGAKAAITDENLDLEDMLLYAIQDEYLARQEYIQIMDQYGSINPFNNIKKSEEMHIEWLTTLYNTYDITLPEDHSIDFVIIPESLTEAYSTGVHAEIENIAMYERFLEEDLPADVRNVFEDLKNASENHLSAFERQLER